MVPGMPNEVCILSPVPSEVALCTPSRLLSKSCSRQDTVLTMQSSVLITPTLQ